MQILSLLPTLPPNPIVSIDQMKIRLTPSLAYDFCGVGIDPGQVNMGLAFVYSSEASLFQIKLPSNMDAVERMRCTATVVDYLLGFCPGDKYDIRDFLRERCMCVIEGAAYGAPNGQVPLAENRTTAAAMVMTRNMPLAILPPSEIKQRIFGKGNTRAGDFWPSLKIRDERDKVMRDDGAAALSCAFYAYAVVRKEAALNERR